MGIEVVITICHCAFMSICVDRYYDEKSDEGSQVLACCVGSRSSQEKATSQSLPQLPLTSSIQESTLCATIIDDSVSPQYEQVTPQRQALTVRISRLPVLANSLIFCPEVNLPLALDFTLYTFTQTHANDALLYLITIPCPPESHLSWPADNNPNKPITDPPRAAKSVLVRLRHSKAPPDRIAPGIPVNQLMQPKHFLEQLPPQQTIS
ncbi:uncharacterized protein CLUP02_10966 [Colletotrichum lupini]|uniref:Uncharacterized protein n=1 Tax=Colletotrichum lupini TaxID=145971 RepID=A0A9Q8SXR7_9PEZI|nr:uncharacterized protein CLUP02_10966 [Colletotrichum lupini]UQC85468.1 hypothetical protein CLUP02_10966 [Colletotrichum lupini]